MNFKDKKFYDALISNDKALQLSNIEFGEKHLTTATLLEIRVFYYWN